MRGWRLLPPRCSGGQARSELPGRPQHPGCDRAAGGGGGGRRGARDRRWSGRAVRAAGRLGRVPARGRGRPAAGGRAAARPVRVLERDGAYGRRARSRSVIARPGADRGGREPAVLDRRHGDPAHDRRAGFRGELGRDGSARGRGAVGGIGRRSGLRGAVRARAAGLRGARAAAGGADRVPAGAPRRLGAGGSAPAGSVRFGATRLCARSSTMRSRIGARRSRGRWPWLRGLCRACASGRAKRWSSWGTRPTSGPSGSRPRSSASSRRCSGFAREADRARAGQGQPVPVPRAGASGWPARAGDGVRVGLAG